MDLTHSLRDDPRSVYVRMGEDWSNEETNEATSRIVKISTHKKMKGLSENLPVLSTTSDVETLRQRHSSPSWSGGPSRSRSAMVRVADDDIPFILAYSLGLTSHSLD